MTTPMFDPRVREVMRVSDPRISRVEVMRVSDPRISCVGWGVGS